MGLRGRLRVSGGWRFRAVRGGELDGDGGAEAGAGFDGDAAIRKQGAGGGREDGGGIGDGDGAVGDSNGNFAADRMLEGGAELLVEVMLDGFGMGDLLGSIGEI